MHTHYTGSGELQSSVTLRAPTHCVYNNGAHLEVFMIGTNA